jgi:hypothetical protein
VPSVHAYRREIAARLAEQGHTHKGKPHPAMSVRKYARRIGAAEVGAPGSLDPRLGASRPSLSSTHPPTGSNAHPKKIFEAGEPSKKFFKNTLCALSHKRPQDVINPY